MLSRIPLARLTSLLAHALVLVVLAALLGAAPTEAADAESGASLTLDVPPGYADTDAPLTLTLLDADGAPLAGEQVQVERRKAGKWRQVATLTTDDQGAASTTLTRSKQPKDNRVRATWAGDPNATPPVDGASAGPLTMQLRPRSSRPRLLGPSSVVDEQSIDLTIRWRTGNGDPVSGRVKLQRRDPGQQWRTVRRPRTGDDGTHTFTTTPRVDTRWRVLTQRRPWIQRGVSPVKAVDNVPPGDPVVLPKAAPAPRRSLPRAPRAVGAGANAVVTGIPSGVWRSMVGRSWHRGCPVGRSQLRLLRVNYWGYDGYRYRGELVARADVMGQMRGVFETLYARDLPVRSMVRVDRFGWSPKLQGANDYASMAAGNTSAFNCRQVVGRPGVNSPHTYGRALDLNTWENPYYSAGRWWPDTWWVNRSHPRVAWRSTSHAVVRILKAHGFRWTYGTQDSQHFDAVPRNARVAPRMLLPKGCRTQVCD
ncbi:M15 family metallopeptidase [Nocardioides acrostichi]|uniref:M15 family metallopeptidase n=1 Tax=Nocardioides acrostichi TaxID=2784339 RepID=A0A930UTS3_9ACTN|nr:M15 family metallopeptidase [Nocardioides acrostichi]MBF4160061.1 M15 family metallopeptidase [Nocardioides acrostichi]